MTKSVRIAVFLFVCSAFGWPAYAAESADQQTVSKLEDDFNDAIMTKGKATLERLMIEDFTSTDESGKVLRSRSEFIDVISKWPKVIESKYSDQVTKVYGNTAVATGRWTGKPEGDTETTDTRYTDTFAKGADGWKVVATQSTIVSKK